MNEKTLLDLLNERYGLSLNEISFLREGGTKTYIAQGRAGKYLLKIIGPAFGDTVRRSASVMRYLTDRGFPAPKVIDAPDGQLTPEIVIGGKTQTMLLTEFIEGDEPDLENCAEAAGDLTGRMHAVLAEYPGKPIVRDEQFFIGRYADMLGRQGYAKADAYRKLGAALWNRVAGLPACVCHGDLHRGNLLQSRDGKLWLLDFDTVCVAPRMFDVMVMCDMTDYFTFDPADLNTAVRVYRQFLTGYCRRVPLTEEERLSFFSWIAVRHFQLQATIFEIHGVHLFKSEFADRQLIWLEQMLAASERIRL